MAKKMTFKEEVIESINRNIKECEETLIEIDALIREHSATKAQVEAAKIALQSQREEIENMQQRVVTNGDNAAE